MVFKVTTTLLGVDELLKKFDKLPERIGKNASRRSLRKGANVIRDIARSNARKLDDPKSTNKIWKNIVVKGGGRRKEAQVKGTMVRVGVLGGARDLTAYGEFLGDEKGNPGGDTWYWRLVEFGASEFAAKPFMRPAMEAGADKAYSTIVEDLNKQLDKEIAKL